MRPTVIPTTASEVQGHDGHRDCRRLERFTWERADSRVWSPPLCTELASIRPHRVEQNAPDAASLTDPWQVIGPAGLHRDTLCTAGLSDYVWNSVPTEPFGSEPAASSSTSGVSPSLVRTLLPSRTTRMPAEVRLVSKRRNVSSCHEGLQASPLLIAVLRRVSVAGLPLQCLPPTEPQVDGVRRVVHILDRLLLREADSACSPARVSPDDNRTGQYFAPPKTGRSPRHSAVETGTRPRSLHPGRRGVYLRRTSASAPARCGGLFRPTQVAATCLRQSTSFVSG